MKASENFRPEALGCRAKIRKAVSLREKKLIGKNGGAQNAGFI